MTPHELVLHTLRVGGHGSDDLLARTSGLPGPEIGEVLLDLQATGLVVRLPGAFGGWAPSDAGRAEAERRARADLAEPAVAAEVAAAYDAFLELNTEALDASTAWQLRTLGGVASVNHHDDPGYDAQVLRRLGRLLDRSAPVLARLAAAVPRFQRYGDRLAAALGRARGGDRSAVTEATDSLHAVWFQLHEDLLVTLGRPRW